MLPYLFSYDTVRFVLVKTYLWSFFNVTQFASSTCRIEIHRYSYYKDVKRSVSPNRWPFWGGCSFYSDLDYACQTLVFAKCGRWLTQQRVSMAVAHSRTLHNKHTQSHWHSRHGSSLAPHKKHYIQFLFCMGPLTMWCLCAHVCTSTSTSTCNNCFPFFSKQILIYFLYADNLARSVFMWAIRNFIWVRN